GALAAAGSTGALESASAPARRVRPGLHLAPDPGTADAGPGGNARSCRPRGRKSEVRARVDPRVATGTGGAFARVGAAARKPEIDSGAPGGRPLACGRRASPRGGIHAAVA